MKRDHSLQDDARLARPPYSVGGGRRLDLGDSALTQVGGNFADDRPGLARALILETFIRALLVLVLAVVTFMLYEYSRYDTLTISERGIKFPIALAPGLLFRRKRTWDDIADILLGSMVLHDKKGAYEYDLETAKDRKKLFIYFKSGGHATIDLNRMPKESVEKLFSAVESWCITSSRVPPPAKQRQPKKLSQKQLDAISYTQMWEEELQSHFRPLISCPWKKGRKSRTGAIR